MHLKLQTYASPIGDILLVMDDSGAVRALDFHDYETRLHRLLRLHYGDYRLENAPAPPSPVAMLDAYFAGDLTAIDGLPVATGGTDFQRTIWRALRAIPPGQTITYSQLAERIGKPAASRAVGLANGANPIAIIVPCHRVIGANGSLTGYGGGLHRKEWLLGHESLTH